MSGRTASERVADGRLAAVGRVADASPVTAATLAGLCALLPVVATTLYRVANNAPGSLPGRVTDLAAVVLPAAVAGPAVAALGLAAVAERSGERVGLTLVGAFGLVALASPTAWLPAVVGAVVGAGALAGDRLWPRVRRRDATAVRPALAALALVAGVAVSLAATAGVAPATGRPLGGALALVGAGLVPTLVEVDRLDLLWGGVVAVAGVALATNAPYVAGAVLLVGGGVVGVPLGLVALGVGGAVAALVAGLRRGRGDAAFGGALLLAAGVPGTLPRALGVVVALALLVPAGGESA
jgi:hypothetical protein